MKDTEMDTPQLEQLMTVYYHEDFDMHGDLWGALDQYLTDSTTDDIANLQRELSAVLLTSTEAEVEMLLDSWSCAVYMGDEPTGYWGWLEEIARRAATA